MLRLKINNLLYAVIAHVKIAPVSHNGLCNLLQLLASFNQIQSNESILWTVQTLNLRFCSILMYARWSEIDDSSPTMAWQFRLAIVVWRQWARPTRRKRLYRWYWTVRTCKKCKCEKAQYRIIIITFPNPNAEKHSTLECSSSILWKRRRRKKKKLNNED